MSQTLGLPYYSALYAFGDSLSDAGNVSIVTALTGATEPVSPPYYKEQYGPVAGHVFSNGPVWVQDLSTALGLGTLAPSLAGGTDFAYGGAETGSTPQNAGDTETQLLSLPSQLTQFQTLVPNPSANALYTLSIGANDLLDILANAGLTVQQQATDVADAVANEIGFVRNLIEDGAKNLLVMDVPDLGSTPDVTEGLVNGSDTPSATLDAEASQLASTYNSSLTGQLASIATADTVNVRVLDAYGLLDSAIASPSTYGLTNVTSPVWNGNFTSATSGTLAATGLTAQDQYLFFDKLHPTETGQQVLATTAAADLSDVKDLQGSSGQYVIADNQGVLYLQDTVAGRDGTQTLPGITTMVFTDGTGVFDPTGTAEDVARLYQATFDRAPDVAGLQFWTAEIDDSHVSLTTVANDFVASPEFIKDYGSPSSTGFVTQIYQNSLARQPDAAGLSYWDGVLGSGTSQGAVLAGIAESQESDADSLPTAGDTTNAEVYRLYETVLDRAPDPGGLANWAGALDSGSTPAQVAQDLLSSAEFIQKYGTLSTSDFISTMYENALHRAPDAAGLQYWTNAMQQGESQAKVAVGFSDSLESRTLYANATHANWVFIPASA